MKVAVAFAIGFLLIMVVTLVVPIFPPAQFLFEYLRIPQSTLSISGISVASLLNGITNGFFWVIIAAAVYGLTRLTQRNDELLPMPTPPHLSTPPPESTPVDSRVDKIPPALTVPPKIVRKKPVRVVVRKKPVRVMLRKQPIGMGQDVETIEGIGPIYGGLLRNSGINTVTDLLRVGAKESGRRYLASQVGVSHETVLKWIYRGDLQRVRGIGKKYASLLESAGVNTVTDLSNRTPRYLSQTLRVVNREKNVVRRTPPSKTIEIWVNNARTLEPIVVE